MKSALLDAPERPLHGQRGEHRDGQIIVEPKWLVQLGERRGEGTEEDWVPAARMLKTCIGRSTDYPPCSACNATHCIAQKSTTAQHKAQDGNKAQKHSIRRITSM